MDQGPQGSSPHQSCVFPYSHRRTDYPDDRSVDLCLFDDSWLVVLWRKSCRVPPWTESSYSLPLAMGWRSLDGLASFSPDSLVARRRYQRPHGNSVPDFIDRAQRRHRRRNTSLSVEQQFRCRGAFTAELEPV